jgi:hypothetical protein
MPRHHEDGALFPNRNWRNQMNAPATYQEVITTNISGYVTEFHKYSKKSIESYLDMCRVVWIAKEKLYKQEFTQFCVEIGEAGSKASISKMRSIGKYYNLFKNHIDQLPSAWTTLYTLASIKEDLLESYLSDNTINPQIDGKEAKALVPRKVKYIKTDLSALMDDDSQAVPDDDASNDVHSSDDTVSANGDNSPATANVTVDAAIDSSDTSIIRQFGFRIATNDNSPEFEEQLFSELFELCNRLNADLFELDLV